jgi:hypothetical protein
LDAGESLDVVVKLTDGARNLDNGQRVGAVEFVNLTTHEGDTSRDVRVDVGRELTAESWTFDEDPQWACGGEWEFGTPLGQGGSGPLNPDPSSGATGSHVYGANLAGDIQAVKGGPYHLTAGPIDLSLFSTVELSYQRWLNQAGQPYGSMWVETSADGASWTTLWDHGTEQGVADDAWQSFSFDVTDELAGAEAARLRWGYAVDRAVPYIGSGWNLDDVALTGSTETERVSLSVTGELLSWSSVPGAFGYDVVRGDVGELLASGGDFSTATEECLADDLEALELSYGASPAPGDASWMLVRGVAVEAALTYQALGPAQVGSRDGGIEAAAASCP